MLAQMPLPAFFFSSPNCQDCQFFPTCLIIDNRPISLSDALSLAIASITSSPRDITLSFLNSSLWRSSSQAATPAQGNHHGVNGS